MGPFVCQRVTCRYKKTLSSQRPEPTVAHSWGLAHDLWELQPGRGQGGGPQVHLALPRGDFTHQSWLQSTWARSLKAGIWRGKRNWRVRGRRGLASPLAPRKAYPLQVSPRCSPLWA